MQEAGDQLAVEVVADARQGGDIPAALGEIRRQHRRQHIRRPFAEGGPQDLDIEHRQRRLGGGDGRHRRGDLSGLGLSQPPAGIERVKAARRASKVTGLAT